MIHLYDTWNKVKKTGKFKKPRLHFKCGLWKNDPCLPVWRRGPSFFICSPFRHPDKVYQLRSDNLLEINHHYVWSRHKLPGGLRCYDYYWTSKVRKGLRKYHLPIIKPLVQLPLWLAFYCYNYDVVWKSKWDDVRYEYPPQFTLVFFGISFSWWLSAPEGEANYDYWEKVIEESFKHN